MSVLLEITGQDGMTYSSPWDIVKSDIVRVEESNKAIYICIPCAPIQLKIPSQEGLYDKGCTQHGLFDCGIAMP